MTQQPRQPESRLATVERIVTAGCLPAPLVVTFVVGYFLFFVRVKNAGAWGPISGAIPGIIIGIMVVVIVPVIVGGIVACFIRWKTGFTAFMGGFGMCMLGLIVGWLLVWMGMRL